MKLIVLILLFSLTAFGEEIVLTENNHVPIVGDVDKLSMQQAKESLLEIDKLRTDKSNKIYIVLKSGGGSVVHGLEFIEIARSVENVHTITITAHSMAACIVQAVVGTRYATKDGTIMFHEMRMFVQPNYYSRQDLKRILEEYEGPDTDLFERYSYERLKLDKQKYQELVKDVDWKLDAKKAVQNNAIDRIVSVKCSKQLKSKKIIKNVQTFIGVIPVEFPACPLEELK